MSRGLLNEGVMAGEHILSFILLHLSGVERSPTLFPWLETWMGKKLELLDPGDWFQLGHDIRGWTLPHQGGLLSRPVFRKGVFVWSPPPAAADVALEQLRIARIKRQESTHVFLVPRLFTPKWLKQLWKACDVILTIPAGTKGWPANMHEPLLIGICFPFLRCSPWQFRGTPKMFQVARDLRRLFKKDEVDPRSFLRKFWKDSHRMHALPEDVVSRMLHFIKGSDLPHRSEGGRSDRPHGGRRRRGSDDLIVGSEEKKPRCF